jgi:Cu-Zn family superoxide dismutase
MDIAFENHTTHGMTRFENNKKTGGKRNMRPLSIFLLVAASSALAFPAMPPAQANENIQEAIAIIHPVQGQKVTGEMHIVPAEDGLKITGKLSNLEPGSHGFHVHRYGNCTAPNEGSVGPHFSLLMGEKGYRGDLPDVEADMKGMASYEAVVKTLTLSGEYSIIGRGMVIHALNGDKIGCGVIGIAK